MSKTTREFWNSKVLNWESDKYLKRGHLCRWIDPNASVKWRLELGACYLRPMVRGRSVLEVGCGSAQLAEKIISWGASSYTGIDISERAIESARARIAMTAQSEKIRLLAQDCAEIGPLRHDVFFSLGLLDWLSLSAIAELNEKIDCEFILHSFSEKKFSLSQALHRLYVLGMYGYRNMSYTPRYYERGELAQALGVGQNWLNFFNHPKMSFGCFVSNFEVIGQASE